MQSGVNAAYFSGESALFEPHRLAVVLLLAGERDSAMGFTVIRRLLGLTDGNLNRHLNRLAEEGLVVIQKTPGASGRIRTMITLQREGRIRLAAFCRALGEVSAEGLRVAGEQTPSAEDIMWRRPQEESPRPGLDAPAAANELATAAAGGFVDNRFQAPD
jgi:DNA-binding MarR family transcriptional regulator